MDRISNQKHLKSAIGRLILAQPLKLKESLRIRDGLEMADARPVSESAYTPVAIKTSNWGFLWICRN